MNVEKVFLKLIYITFLLTHLILIGCSGDGSIFKGMEATNSSSIRSTSQPSITQPLPHPQCKLNSPDVLNAIYDEDDRKPIGEVSQFLPFANRVAGLVQSQLIDKNGNVTPYSPSLRSLKNLCSSEPYSDIPIVANCTGSLIASNLIVTAAHCVRDLPACSGSTYVFNLSYSNEAKNPLVNKLSNVYKCKSLPFSDYQDNRDIALVRLDRQVTGRKPFKVNLTRELEEEEPLVCIGQSEGLPLMVSPVGAFKGEYRDYLMHSIDTFGGNSGAPVFSGETVVAVHAKRRIEHYIPGGSCDIRQRVEANPERYNRPGEGFWGQASDTRVLKEQFENSIVALSGDVTNVTQSGSNMTIEGWACALARQDAVSVDVLDSQGAVLSTVSAGENIGTEDEGFCQSGATHNFRITTPVQNSVRMLVKFGGEEMELIAKGSESDSSEDCGQ